VIQQSESGLLGMALHPAFSTIPEVFLAYTYLSSGLIRERIVKYRYENDSLINPVFLVNNMPGNGTHNGCRLHFLPDTTLLASTGDVQNLSLPQDTGSLSGKILRMKTDGTAPADNPFAGNLVYSFGHRNVQGIAALPDGKIMLSEHGASTDDEVQILLPGRNYGWPNVEGFCSTPTENNFCTANQVVEPIRAYTPTIAPSDMVFYKNPFFPEWNNTLLLTILKNKQVRAIRMNAANDSVVSDVAYLSNRFGRLRDICVGANREIYLATNGASWANTDPNTHSIIRLRPVAIPTAVKGLLFSPVSLKLFPNPASGRLEIQFEGSENTRGSINIINAQGKVVFSREVNGNQLSLDTSEIGKAGLYFVSFRNEAGQMGRAEKLRID
jgi:glucose/arabinose dehydrogenase